MVGTRKPIQIYLTKAFLTEKSYGYKALTNMPSNEKILKKNGKIVFHTTCTKNWARVP